MLMPCVKLEAHDLHAKPHEVNRSVYPSHESNQPMTALTLDGRDVPAGGVSTYMTATTSSILRIIPTHSVASLSALELTSTGWMTCSAYMSLMVPLRTLIPARGGCVEDNGQMTVGEQTRREGRGGRPGKIDRVKEHRWRTWQGRNTQDMKDPKEKRDTANIPIRRASINAASTVRTTKALAQPP